MQTSTPAPAGNRLLFRFLVVAAAMYLAWFFGYEQWLATMAASMPPCASTLPAAA